MYPPIEPYEQGWLAVGDGHEMYYELSGNPAGAPVLFLHGGPGSSTRPQHRRFFDPAFYRIVLMDQRGCGRSKPYGAIAHNTTHHLVRDVEVLRLKLGVDSWLLFGGSWGSTLALFYAIAHPQRVRGLVLRGGIAMVPARIARVYSGCVERLQRWQRREYRGSLFT
jgi:proline iminopeptidase